MKEQIQENLENRLAYFVGRQSSRAFTDIDRKITALANRKAEIVKTKANAQVLRREDDGDYSDIVYQLHMQYVVKQSGTFYIEEEIEERKASFYRGSLFADQEIAPEYPLVRTEAEGRMPEHDEAAPRIAYVYDRLSAVQYAEKWWNSFNPAYKSFTDDCTNFISQCLRAGGAPMRGYPDRSKGWWMQNKNWSYSWTVANSLKTYLQYAKTGLRTREVAAPENLKYGDIICYDFQGDGRFDHNTIVTGYDAAGMPLVNAHTSNSRKRYWAYEDSSAYTPNIKYKFFTIEDDS